MINTSSKLAPVVITQFKLFDKLVKGANEKKEIVLRHDENYFAFEFASLSFYNTDKNQYAYKLEGVDKDWVYSGSRRYAGYTNVGPGKHTFKVKATNNDGVWNEEGVSLVDYYPATVVANVVGLLPLWIVVYCCNISIHRYQNKE